MSDDPGPLIGKGRVADVFDLGGGRVLRRNRNGRDHGVSAHAMQYLHGVGFPVPAVFEISGADLVMEKVDGRTMLDSFTRRPWKIRSWARLLADLHRRLGEIAVPDLDLPSSLGEPEVLIHGDLHPDNVFLTKRGPVVIDWDNIAVGPKGAEPAYTWVVMATSEVDGSAIEQRLIHGARGWFVDAFVDASGRDIAVQWLPTAAELRLHDPNVRPGEADAIRRLVNAHR